MVRKEKIRGLILAGGAGSRVAGQDKGLIPWEGKTLVEHVICRIQPQVGKVLLSCNRNLKQYEQFSPNLVQDQRPDYQGPLAGLEAATSLLGDCEYLVIVACDTPLLPLDLVQRLLKPMQTGEDSPVISYANDGDRDQYLFAAVKCTALDSLNAYLESGQRAVRHWFDQQQAVAVDFSDQQDAFENFNYLGSSLPSS